MTEVNWWCSDEYEVDKKYCKEVRSILNNACNKNPKLSYTETKHVLYSVFCIKFVYLTDKCDVSSFFDTCRAVRRFSRKYLAAKALEKI